MILQKNKVAPGPGQYPVNEALFRDPKAASIKGRPKTTKDDLKPGPGHYQSKSLHSSPAYSMGLKTKIKEIMSKDNPGPGGYNPDYKNVKQSAPGVAFGSPSKSNSKEDSAIPGPGQYQLKTTVGTEGPAYGIRGRHETKIENKAPGPGNYNPKDEYTRFGTPGTIIGKGKRDELTSRGQAPGPGNYELNSSLEKGKMYSFGTERRDGSLEKQSNSIPGPGTYVSQSFVGKESQGKSISGKCEIKIKNENPGPGAYNPDDKKHGPAYSLLGHRTDDPILIERSKMPPPGNYNPNDSFIKHSAPNVSFGVRPKTTESKSEANPGPGQYQLKSTLVGVGAYIGVKTEQKLVENSPGPCAYNPKDDLKYNTGPAFSIAGVTGDSLIKNKEIPGPGTYDVTLRPNTGVRIGTEKRKELGGKGDSPGPGQYQIPDRTGKEGKNIVLTGRHEDKQTGNHVGPGQYQLPSSLSGPKFSMGSGDKGTKLNKDSLLNPPPGTYNVNANVGKHGSPNVVFGKDKRDKSKDDPNPGPGNYPLPSTIDSKGATIKGKYNEKIIDRAPGPGAYDSKVNPLLVHGGGIVFGHDAKTSGPKESGAPGPGMYKVDMPYKGGHIFGKDNRDKSKSSGIPGPGHYDTRKLEGLTYY